MKICAAPVLYGGSFVNGGVLSVDRNSAQYLNALSDAEKEDFEDDIFRRVEKAYPVQKNGEIIFRFPRLFFTAQKI